MDFYIWNWVSENIYYWELQGIFVHGKMLRKNLYVLMHAHRNKKLSCSSIYKIEACIFSKIKLKSVSA